VEALDTLDDARALTEDSARLKGVVLRFAGARYAVDMTAVAEVVQIPHVTRIPGAPSWVHGVVNWRGRVLPVLDLRPLVGAAQAPLPTSARLVVLSADDVECGVVADLVPGLLECSPEDVAPMPVTTSSGIASILRGIVDSDGPVALLDADAVLRLREQLPAARRGPR